MWLHKRHHIPCLLSLSPVYRQRFPPTESVPHTCPPKQGQWEPAKESPDPQAQEGKTGCGGGQVTEPRQGSMVRVPDAQEAAGCGDWDNSSSWLRAHRASRQSVQLAGDRRQSCGASHTDSARCDDVISGKMLWVPGPLEGGKGSYWDPAPPTQPRPLLLAALIASGREGPAGLGKESPWWLILVPPLGSSVRSGRGKSRPAQASSCEPGQSRMTPEIRKAISQRAQNRIVVGAHLYLMQRHDL